MKTDKETECLDCEIFCHFRGHRWCTSGTLVYNYFKRKMVTQFCNIPFNTMISYQSVKSTQALVDVEMDDKQLVTKQYTLSVIKTSCQCLFNLRQKRCR